MVFVFAALYGVTKTQGALLTVICALVISLEAVNTAIEAAVDLETSQKSRLAKIAKDAAAAAVLISAVGAVGSAVCIFSDLYRALAVFVTLFTPPRLIFTLIFIGAALWFIFGIKNNLKGKDN